MIDSITKYILEKQYVKEKGFRRVIQILKDIGLDTVYLYKEPESCKRLRITQKYMWLLHGTRPQYVQDIKREGLRLSAHGKRTKAEGDIIFDGKPCIWFGLVYSGKTEGFGSRGTQYGVKYMVARVETKYLEFNASAYQYYKDVPPKDLIWNDNPEFLKIINRSSCLVNKSK